ncbi:MAG: universal bacterial protein YeaZ [Chthonomonadaceae bacterium]|nr:universal bacterial protein YeaZ [Chthonomonadaceae bacterium]
MTETERESIFVAIETSGDLCGVALLRDGVLAVEQTFRHHMHLSEGLLDTLQTVLRAAGLSLADVTGLAVGIGPGSFTGTRIGVMTAKTLAAVREIPLYGVIGLEALAWAYRGLREVRVVPMLPCRTGVVFTARYDVSGPHPVAETDPDALALDALAEQLIASSNSRVLLCGAAVPRYGESLRTLLEERDISVSLGDERLPRAALIGMLAYQRVAGGVPADAPFDLVPLYISPPPITMPKIPIPQ